MEETKKALLVDDQQVVRRLLGTILHKHGFQVVTADNGHEAVRAAELERPDIILMDLEMPLMNGIDATRVLKANAKTADIPIVVLTAGTTRERVVEAKRVGAKDVMTKSGFGLDDFLERLLAVIEVKA